MFCQPLSNSAFQTTDFPSETTEKMLLYRITTLGCKVNQYEGQALGATLNDWGLTEASDPDIPADLLIVNTCCITTTAMRKSRKALRRLFRQNPGAAVFVAGCYADYDPRKIQSALRDLGAEPHRIQIAGHHKDVRARLEQWIQDLGRDEPTEAEEIDREEVPIRDRRLHALAASGPAGTAGLAGLKEFAGHQRAFVKIQDGCDAFCSYCIVPYMRPRLWSPEPGQILRECERLIESGHKEIVLCGVFLGAFGRETANRSRWQPQPDALAELTLRVADLPGLWRVRLSSLEPGDLTEELLETLKHPKVAPHLHLPLQSGSGDILRRMNRQYTPGDFLKTAARLQEQLELVSLTTDIIVGFPGESEEDFQQSLDVARQAEFSKIHAFPFSPIRGTAAWSHRDEVPPRRIVKHRMDRLARLEASLASDYRKKLLGLPLEALVEAGDSEDSTCAMTDRYVTARFACGDSPPSPGNVVRFVASEVTRQGLWGSIR